MLFKIIAQDITSVEEAKTIIEKHYNNFIDNFTGDDQYEK